MLMLFVAAPPSKLRTAVRWSRWRYFAYLLISAGQGLERCEVWRGSWPVSPAGLVMTWCHWLLLAPGLTCRADVFLGLGQLGTACPTRRGQTGSRLQHLRDNLTNPHLRRPGRHDSLPPPSIHLCSAHISIFRILNSYIFSSALMSVFNSIWKLWSLSADDFTDASN